VPCHRAVPAGVTGQVTGRNDGMGMRRSRSRGGAPADDRVRSLLTVSVLVCGFVFLAWVTTSGSPLRWQAARSDAPPLRAPLHGQCPRGSALTAGRHCHVAQTRHSAVWDVVASLAQWIGTAALVAIAVALLVLLWRSRPTRGERVVEEFGPDMTFLPEVAVVVIDDAEAQLSALREGSARNAIVACWMRLEQSIERAGLPIPPSDTSAELVVRALSRYPLDRPAIDGLAALYREARFSRHDITEPMREAALDALTRLHRGLREHRSTVEAP
jgi:hypothetical protein